MMRTIRHGADVWQLCFRARPHPAASPRDRLLTPSPLWSPPRTQGRAAQCDQLQLPHCGRLGCRQLPRAPGGWVCVRGVPGKGERGYSPWMDWLACSTVLPDSLRCTASVLVAVWACASVWLDLRFDIQCSPRPHPLQEIGEWMDVADMEVRASCINAFVSGLVKVGGAWRCRWRLRQPGAGPVGKCNGVWTGRFGVTISVAFHPLNILLLLDLFARPQPGQCAHGLHPRVQLLTPSQTVCPPTHPPHPTPPHPQPAGGALGRGGGPVPGHAEPLLPGAPHRLHLQHHHDRLHEAGPVRQGGRRWVWVCGGRCVGGFVGVGVGWVGGWVGGRCGVWEVLIADSWSGSVS